jgi:hypothetical protein
MSLDPSYKEVLGTRKFASVGSLKPGSLIQFTYNMEQKHALVLNPNWEGKLHALSLVGLSPEDTKQILAEVSNLNNSADIYETYKNSKYTMGRSYRTYLINKISALREIYLKREEKK